MRWMIAGAGNPACLRSASQCLRSVSLDCAPDLLDSLVVLMVISYFDVIQSGNGVVHQHRGRAIQRNQIRPNRIAIDAHEANRQPPEFAHPGVPVGKVRSRLVSFRRLRSKRMLVLPPAAVGRALPSTKSLSHGTMGKPRQVRKGVPNSVTVAGGTPRRVHSRPKAAICAGSPGKMTVPSILW